MANTFLNPEKIVSQGLGLLQRQLILPRLVQRLGIADYRQTKNTTINIKIPSILPAHEYEWRTRAKAIEVDELEEFSIPVTLNKHVVSAVTITDEELTFDIGSWGEQVARPQIEGVGRKLESYVATAMETDANYRHEVVWIQGDPEDDDRSLWRAATKANRYLNEENVPVDGRILLVGAAAEEAALNSKHLVDVDTSGTDGVLRDAIIGRIAGFTVVGRCNSVDPDFAVAFHPTAFALGNVAPVVPDGVTTGATMTYDSLAMRWIRDYDADHLRDRSVYSSFAGAVSVEDGRNWDEEDADFGELTEENVRAVKLDFSPFGEGS